MNPTSEQQAALEAFATGGSMVIEAGAGTGKTTTLRLLAESTTRRGLYLAYNKAIQTDAEKDFPSNVNCRTAHSLAYGAVGKFYRARLNAPRVPARQAVAILGLPEQGLLLEGHHLASWTLARLTMDTVRRFCYSADGDLKLRHVPKVDGMEEVHDEFAKFLLPFAVKAWADIESKTGRLKFEHDHYLKLWALTNPKLNFDFVLFDEAQDANPVIAQVVISQDSQKILVGDRCQAIYGWRGAVDAMTSFPADHRLLLSQSFRFGPAVAAEANKWLDRLDSPLRLEGFDQIASEVTTITDPDAILCRTNAEVVSQAMGALEDGRKVAIVGGTSEIQRFAEAAQDLMNNRKTNHPELVAFKNWQEVQEYVEEDGADLKTMVRLIENYGTQAVLEVCAASTAKEADADVIISTAHKAKGREWNRVRIAGDFKAPEDGVEPSRPEMMLAYVAVTRAKLALDKAGLAWIDSLAVAS